jgi:hypothetical protein
VKVAARKLRVRVGIGGMEVVHPKARELAEVEPFLRSNAAWIVSQLDRVDRLRSVRKPRPSNAREILYRGYLNTRSDREGGPSRTCQQSSLPAGLSCHNQRTGGVDASGQEPGKLVAAAGERRDQATSRQHHTPTATVSPKGLCHGPTYQVGELLLSAEFVL